MLSHQTIVLKFVCYSNVFLYFYYKTTCCCFMWFIIPNVEIIRKQTWRDFLLNGLNLLIFNISFTANFGRLPGISSLWEFILCKYLRFRSAALLGMSSYAGVLGSLLKCPGLPILQNTTEWLLPFVFTFRKYLHSYIIH